MIERKIRLLVCDRLDVAQLGLEGEFEVDYKPKITREELLKTVGGYDGLVVRSRTRVDSLVMEKAPRLRIVARPGTGLDNIDVSAAESMHIAIVNSPESLVEAVAEHVFLLMLALSRKLVWADSSLKEGRWMKDSFVGTELKGKCLGVVGMGRIGVRVGEIGTQFGMSIAAHDVVPISEEVVRSLRCTVTSLESLLGLADYLTIHVPLTPETRHLIDSRRLSMMKKTAYLINTSRGGVVEEESLVEALKGGRLAGAALDVFETEPPQGKLLSTPNIILTPHIGGQTLEAQAHATKAVGKKIELFFEGRKGLREDLSPDPS